tara:strand:+ start:6832 stop:7005 length:174 start_codon:yes stop_codon:yes gene_type:complete
MKNYDEILENLKAQKKQIEAQYLKIEGAIEIITSIAEDESKKKKTASEAQQVPKAKK